MQANYKGWKKSNKAGLKRYAQAILLLLFLLGKVSPIYALLYLAVAVRMP